MVGQIYGEILKRSFMGCSHLCTSRKLHETHYEVLKLPPNCSGKQIKDAFIKLSKEHHPDVCGNKLAHAKFLKISEAYTVLGKPESRRNYDLGLRSYRSQPVGNSNAGPEIRTTRPMDNPLFWRNRNKSQDNLYRDRSYYGIDGVQKVSNGTILLLCIVAAIFGVSLQVLLIKKSFTFQRTELMRRSEMAQEYLDQTVKTANNNGNALQIELLKAKLLTKPESSSDEE